MESSTYWRIVYFWPAFLLVLYIYNTRAKYPFETVIYLLEQGRKEEARELANVIYKEEYVEERI